MSGIEIAGLILGAIPVLLEGLDLYRAGLSRVGAGFRKRKYVEKLSRALRLHKDTLEGLITSVIVSSGCSDSVEPKLLVEDPNIQEDVAEYLGSKSLLTLTEALQDCDTIFQSLARKVSELVPSVKGSTDLAKIIERNSIDKGRADLLARVKLVFGVQEIQNEVERLDASIATLDRFIRITLGNRQLTGDQPSSRRAAKLARTFRKIRRHADDLYVAVAHGWLDTCHQSHEANLFLDHRSEETPKSMILKQSLNTDFRVAFAGTSPLGDTFWHETEVQIVEDDGSSVGHGSLPSVARIPTIQINAPLNPAAPRRQVQAIDDICSTISDAECNGKCLIFELAENQRFAGAIQVDNGVRNGSPTDSVTLRDLLLKPSISSSSGPVLPWKMKMELALKLTSSWLQLLQTQWVDSDLSSNAVLFMISTPKQRADLSRPFVSRSFKGTGGLPCSNLASASVRRMLLELGVVLLEIWHEQTFETKFPSAASGVSDRRARALDWLEDDMNPLPNLYYSAVHRCIVSVMEDGSRLPEWQDMTLWKAVCSGVIEPLFKLSKL